MDRRQFLACAAVALSPLVCQEAWAQDAGGFAGFVETLRDPARAAGVSKETFDAVAATLSFDPSLANKRATQGEFVRPSKPMSTRPLTPAASPRARRRGRSSPRLCGRLRRNTARPRKWCWRSGAWRAISAPRAGLRIFCARWRRWLFSIATIPSMPRNSSRGWCCSRRAWRAKNCAVPGPGRWAIRNSCPRPTSNTPRVLRARARPTSGAAARISGLHRQFLASIRLADRVGAPDRGARSRKASITRPCRRIFRISATPVCWP